MNYTDDILSIAMTKVQLRYDLMRPLDEAMMEQMGEDTEFTMPSPEEVEEMAKDMGYELPF